ncbi:hypothetical protein GR223_05265 [Rhizobium leguminosarum]|uniref:hypothetical protein n=1 Tax=Rhizobium ruizarguesonis TaxID=2081791 RepID=UPI0013E0983C|nr:hypothetical protein [Rhizobium ruizarguesonis]NEJ85361.1 hypothetical protein [Rhizobium ruizarguesonis]
MNTRTLAAWIREMMVRHDGDDDDAHPLDEGGSTALPEEDERIARARKRTAAIIDDLHAALKDSGWQPHPDHIGEQVADEWYFGDYVQRAPIRRIHRGYLEPVLRVPIIERVPADVAYFLISLPGGNDYLDRDTDFGWHYHYLINRNTRTDVILCWDTRWTPSPAGGVRPIFVEKHGEGRYTTRGKPDRWGDTKRESMREACAPDLAAHPVTIFRCASDKSVPVWPRSAVLTPRPAPPNTVKRIGRKSK